MKSLFLFPLYWLSGIAAFANIIVYVYEVGPDVLAQGSGSINTNSLTMGGTIGVIPAIHTSTAFLLGPTGTSQTDSYTVSLTGPTSVGTISKGTSATTGTGDFFGFYRFTGTDQFYLKTGYNSGDPLFATNTYANTTIAGLGLTVGDYTWTWGSGADADSWTVLVGTSPPIPEPSHFALVAGLVILAAGAVPAAFRRGRARWRG